MVRTAGGGHGRCLHAQATDATGRAAELPTPLAQLRAECPATIEDDRHDQRITRCLELYRAGQLPM